MSGTEPARGSAAPPARRRARRLIALAAHREATTQLRRPEFWISLLMTLLILAASIAVQAAGSPGPGAHTVEVVDGRWVPVGDVPLPVDGGTVTVTVVPEAASGRVPSGTADAPAAAETQRTVMAAIGVGFVFLLMFSFGQTIAHGVLEEKSSRVVEVLLAKLRASHLLAGKVLGLGVVVLSQVGLLVTGGFLAAWLLDLIVDPVDALRVGVIVLAWFVPGYFLFATLWAVAGALASRPEDVVNAAGPVSSIMAAGLLGAVLPYSGTAPVLSAALSVLPGFSWAMMPLRMAREAVPWWQVVLAVALLVLAVAVLLRLAGRIYVGGLMNHGGLLNARTALHHAKESGLT